MSSTGNGATTEDVPKPPEWQQEVIRRRQKNETTQDVQKKWDKHVETGGEGAAPWIQEVAQRKKSLKEKEEAEANMPQWLKEVRQKNQNLAKNFATDAPEN